MSTTLQHPGRMPPATSTFLDALRVLAALVVFTTHILEFQNPAQRDGAAGLIGHDAVVVFFVLSGYVIAYSTLSKHRSVQDYTIARLARLYSVVIPALILTFVLHFAADKLYPGLHQMDRGSNVLRYVLSALFLQEAWKLSASPPSNGPLWSLGYEFWYYALFGAAIVIPKVVWKIGIIAAMLLVVGPKVLLLMPIWLLGVMLFTHGRKIVLGQGWAMAGFLASILALAWAFRSLPSYPAVSGFSPLFYSGSFVSDWAIGCLVTLVIWTFHQAYSHKPVPKRLDAGLKWGAGHTFSLYLYHFPLLVFATAVLPLNLHNPVHIALAIAGVLGIVLTLSNWTEAKRGVWHKGLTRIWDTLARLHGKSQSRPEANVVVRP